MPKTKLTVAAVDRVTAPKGERVEYFDTLLPGFALRVSGPSPGSPSGSKSWVVFYRVKGDPAARLRRMTIGGFPPYKLDDARDEAEAALRLAAKGIDPSAQRKALAPTPGQVDTIDQLIEEYLERWARPKKRSAAEDERTLRRELLGTDMKGKRIDGVDQAATWRGWRVAAVSRRDIVVLLDRIVDRGSPVQANRTLAVIRRMFNFAIERGIIELSPVVKVRAPGKENARERNLNDDEIRAWWLALGHAPMEPNIRRALRFMLATAQRRGEVIGLHESEVDRKQKTWTIPASRTKNGREHVVPLSTLALEILDEAEQEAKALRDARKDAVPAQGAGWYFASARTGRPFLGQSIDHATRDLYRRRHPVKDETKAPPAPVLEKAVPCTPHDLRRTATTKMRELGVSKEDVKMVLNHKDRSVTGEHYDRYEGLPEKRRALDKWSRRLRLLLAPQTSNVVDMHG